MPEACVIVESNKSRPYEAIYEMIRDVGNGSSSYVAACIERGTKYLFATKVLQKKKPGVQDPRSVAVLLKLQHPNITRLREVFETSTFLYLVYEFVEGEQLFHRLSELKNYTEMTIAGYFRQIVEGLRYLHEYGIIHKNLKPENLVLSSRDENAVVKITDAALHNFMIEDMDIEVLCCNTIFCAPELLTSRIFDKTFDLWALGIILHIMLCGSDPYFPKTDSELYRAILNGELLFDNEAWEKVSWNGRDVVRGLLVVDPPQRLNTVQVLEHPWVSGRYTPSEPHLQLSQSQLIQFVERRKEWEADNGRRLLHSLEALPGSDLQLCGSDPYFPKTDSELYRAILNGELLFDNEAWEKVSWNGRDVVRGLLVVDPPQRLNTVQVLEHPWVSGRYTPSEPHLQLSQSQLIQFVERRKEWVSFVRQWIRICFTQCCWLLTNPNGKVIRLLCFIEAPSLNFST
ncbi:hypothetical protein T265_04971 [Opisthorchis viverrini]|uniref:Protein kinase domain-containing protein n=1 Tax=Opisthorchis viverrini TaxID=6198 RepID=A0A074ZXU0_OPIVI|nr:hypothetical protein T265_04971 [Opisthorchis viverrini]KER28140.1 hypothetical protein T265_04971 [Opisthorchis viverrini]